MFNSSEHTYNSDEAVELFQKPIAALSAVRILNNFFKTSYTQEVSFYFEMQVYEYR